MEMSQPTTFFFIFTFLKMACTLQVLANIAPNAVVYPTMRIQVRTYQNKHTKLQRVFNWRSRLQTTSDLTGICMFLLEVHSK